MLWSLRVLLMSYFIILEGILLLSLFWLWIMSCSIDPRE